MERQPSREELLQRIADLEAALEAKPEHPEMTGSLEAFGLADVENAADGICVCHAIDEFPFVRFTFWNRRMVDLCGYGLEEINRQGWYQSVYPDPDYRAKAIARMTQMREGINLEAEEWEITRADGQKRTLRISTSMLEDGAGTPRVMAIMHDVTTPKRAEAELRKEQQDLQRRIERQTELLADTQQALEISDARYRALFDIAGDALFIENDQDDILDVNQRACNLLGYRREELLAMKVSQIQAPEWRGKPGTILKKEMADHQGRPFETVDLHKDGTPIPVEVTVTRLVEAGMFLSIVRDIRARKQTEENLKRSEEKFSKAFQSSPDAIVISRLMDGRILDVNEGFTKASGYGRDEAIGRTTTELGLWADPDDRQRYVQLMVEGGRVRDIEFRFRVKSGALRDGLLSGEVLQIGGEPCLLGTIRDVTENKRAQAEILREKQFADTVIHHLPGSFYMLSEDGRMVRWNDNLERMTGYSAEEVSRMHALDFFPAHEKEKVQQRIEEVFSTGQSQVEANLMGKHGRQIPHMFTGAKITYDGLGYLIGLGIDITLENQVKQALEESETRFRQIAQHTRDVFWLFDWQAQRVLYVSPAYDPIWGRSREALYESYAEWGESIHPEDVPHAEATFARILETGGGEPREYRIIRPDGAVRWISDTGYAIKDAAGNIVRITGIAEDITERKQAEAALNREKERLAVTLRSIGDAVITTDREGRIALMNPIAEHLTGWSEAEAIGQPLMDVFRIVNERTGAPCANPVDTVLATGKMVGLANHTLLVARDGREFAIADSGAPILDREATIIGVVLVYRDITDQLRIEKELSKVEKLESLGVLAGGIAHDFNNFLTGIIGNLSLAKLDLQPGHPVSRALDELEKAALRAKDLTQQLLTFSKGGEPVKHTTRIADLVRESAQFALHGSNVRCRFDIDEALLPADVDESQMAQVIHNLILNADQAMPRGGTIVIQGTNVTLVSDNPFALEPGDYLQLSIRDEGLGIHPEHLKRVFDPYFSTKQKGSGLGLAVAYSIISKHDGQLTVESTLGQGTTFTLLLPASEQGRTPDEARPQDLVAGRGRILVMDDEAFILELATAMLGKMGYDVATAQDGQAALEMYQSALDAAEPFDAVILDLTVPGGMGGKETIRRLIAMDPSVRAIVSSGYSTDPVMANYASYGFCGAVQKPYRVQEMSRVLHAVIYG